MNKVKFEPFDWKGLLPQPVIGVDEVGRGCLAGRVYAAAVILLSDTDIHLYADSKTLSESRREVILESILKNHRVGIGFASAEEIDRVNILQASLLAMKRAVQNLGVTDGHVIVDGNQRIPDLVGFKQTTVVKGDMRAAPIGAASILAKVTRDRLMVELDEQYPGYGFAKHKGYPTIEHKEALQKLGPSREHRLSFAGVIPAAPQLRL